MYIFIIYIEYKNNIYIKSNKLEHTTSSVLLVHGTIKKISS